MLTAAVWVLAWMGMPETNVKTRAQLQWLAYLVGCGLLTAYVNR